MSRNDANTLSARTRAAIRDVPDFPKPGILFRDITPLLADASLLREVIGEMSRPFIHAGITHVIAVESRGFLFGVPIAQLLNAAFVPARKPGKLPRATVDEPFALEYGIDRLSIHADAIDANAQVLIVDDVLATGGTAAAVVKLVARCGATVAGITMLSELAFLNGRSALDGLELHTVVQY